ncbi:MAG: hypothetical protein EAZ70_04790 [Runella slithyformis]|nr:MAG: hypothetical protein EAZ70_04790 [Runella slithyformis]
MPQVVKILTKTHSDEVRNAAALAISDLNGDTYLPELVKIIHKKSVKSKGTLIYALSMLSAEKYFKSISILLLDRNLEVHLETINFVRKFKKKVSIEDLNFTVNLIKENGENFFDKREKTRLLKVLDYQIKKHGENK